MKTRKLVVSCIAAALGLGCSTSQVPSHPFVGTLPPRNRLDLTGTFALAPTGELTLALRDGCVSLPSSANGPAEKPCDKATRDAIRVVAVTPWKAEVRGAWLDASHLVFHVEWADARLHVLAEDAVAMAMRPWPVSGAQWTPSEDDARELLKLVGAATETETEIVHGGESPKLDITSFELMEGTLHAGSAATLVVKMANHGQGAAYRVAATTRSSMPALHGLRMEFGAIPPGGQKTRKIEFEIPADESMPDAMVVLLVNEGNGFAPSNLSRRWPVTAAEPELTAQCVMPEHPTPEPEVNAGEHVTVRCVVSNTGTGPARVALDLSINGGAPMHSRAQDVSAAGRAAFVEQIIIPSDVAVRSTVQLAIVAVDARLGRSARTALNATVRKPKLCEEGKLGRKQYEAKIAELRATVAAGDLTQAQLDRYDAELILCIK